MKAAIKREESQTRLNFPEREQARRSQMLIVIRGAIKAILVDDYKNIIDAKIIRPADGVYTSIGSVQVLCSSPRTYGTLSNAWSRTRVCSR